MPQRLSGRWKLGFGLALTTAILWGAVPVAMTPLLARMDPVTVSWYRFAAAGSVLFALFAARGALRPPRPLGRRALLIFAVAVLTLVGNYVLYVQSLHYIAAPVAQIVVQLAPVLLMLGSLWVFGERFSRLQWCGFAILVAGIAGFCLERLRLGGVEQQVFGLGVLVMVVAAVMWAAYGLAQKELLRYMPSQLVLMGIYLAGTLLMFPVADPSEAFALDGVQLLLLLFLAANTLVAYGAFAEAMNHWESSKVSAVLALQPLTTLFGAHLFGTLWPGYFPPQPLTGFAVAASAVVVAGSMLCALGGRRAPS